MKLLDLQKYLDQSFPKCFIIPAKPGGKAPKYKHKNNQYNSDKFRKTGYKECGDGALIVLSSGIVVVDCDDIDTCDAMETNIPEFIQTVRCQTLNGRHYYFYRTSECKNIWDGSRELKYSNGDAVDIDIKTQSKSGKTPGTISIPPSPNKTWISQLGEGEILPLPDKFVRFHQEFYGDKHKKSNTIDIKNHFVYDAPKYEEIITLVGMLSGSRADEYSSWISVGWCLHNIDVNLLELWDSWSQSSTKHKPGECEKLWVFMRDDGLNIGSLHMWAKEDSPEEYKEYLTKKKAEIFAPGDAEILRDWIKKQFHFPPTRIGDLSVKTYDDGMKYIFVNIDEKWCEIAKNEHEESQVYLSIGFEKSSQKCHHESCKDKKHNQVKTTHEIKKIIENLGVSNCDPIEFFQNFIRESPNNDTNLSELDKMNLELTPPISSFHGTRYHLNNNKYCPIHQTHHPHPENCIMLSEYTRKFAVECNLARWDMYPHDGAQVPQNILQIITGNTINNYYGNTNDDIKYDYLFDDEFKIFDDSELNRLMNASFKGYASDIARVFCYLGSDIFGIQFTEQDSWWSWDELEMRWIKTSHKAHIFCDEVVAEKYYQANRWFRETTLENENQSKRLAKIDGIIKRLKDRDQNSILSQAAILLKDRHRNFENVIDSNKNIINFRGTIFDFETLEFRPTKPRDMISRSTNYELPEIDLEIQSNLMKFIESIMPDQKNIDYLMTWLASSLDGWNREESFHILTGLGRNGKGVLRDLMQNALNGDNSNTNGYCAVMSSTFMTNERPSSDRPVADLMNLKGKRFLVASEPDDDKKINVGFVKFLSGNDPINGRWLQSNAEIVFQPQYTLALLCNNIPKISVDDEAIWMRSRFVHFPYVFTESPSGENEKFIDMGLKPRITNQGPQFMLILLDYYKRYLKFGLKPTPEILNMTQNIRDENDCYQEFIDTKLQKTDNDDRLKQSMINKVCKDWMAQNYNTAKFSKSSLTKAMFKTFGKVQNSVRFSDSSINAGWYKISFK